MTKHPLSEGGFTYVLLDTCVLIPSRLSDVLFDLMLDGLFYVFWTADIEKEFLKNWPLVHTRAPSAGPRRLSAFKNAAIPGHLISNYSSQRVMRQVPNKVHPSDRHVIAAALVLAETCVREGTAHDKIFVVSDNTKDLAPREVQKRGISVLSAGAFLDEIYTAASQRCIAAVNRSLSELKRPPYTRLEMIRSLRLHQATRLANGLRTAGKE